MNAACTGCSDAPSASPSIVRDAIARVRNGECQARIDAPVVDKNRARAALAAVAAFLRAGEADVFAQRIEQRHARLEHQVVVMAVDVEPDGHWRPGCPRSGLVRRRCDRRHGCQAGCKPGRQGTRSVQEASARSAFSSQCFVVVVVHRAPPSIRSLQGPFRARIPLWIRRVTCVAHCCNAIPFYDLGRNIYQ